MILSLIAAIGKNNELGKGNDLLWKIPADMKHFKEITSEHTVIMGRKTFESIGRPLPNRRNIIITRDINYKREGVEIVHSLEEALNLFTSPQPSPEKGEGEKEVFIIGGAEIYKQALPLASKLYITQVEAEDKKADVFFPEINLNEWRETSREEHEPDERNLFKYSFKIYEKN